LTEVSLFFNIIPEQVDSFVSCRHITQNEELEMALREWLQMQETCLCRRRRF